jgi:hypothetical protein
MNNQSAGLCFYGQSTSPRSFLCFQARFNRRLAGAWARLLENGTPDKAGSHALATDDLEKSGRNCGGVCDACHLPTGSTTTSLQRQSPGPQKLYDENLIRKSNFCHFDPFSYDVKLEWQK